MAGINVMVADTDEEAAREFTVVEQMFRDVQTGQRRLIQPPVDPEELGPGGGAGETMLRIKAVGAPATVREQLEKFVKQTGADELITVTYAYDPAVRDRSLELLAQAWVRSSRTARRPTRGNARPPEVPDWPGRLVGPPGRP